MCCSTACEADLVTRAQHSVKHVSDSEGTPRLGIRGPIRRSVRRI
jgi:hypothetical protein